MNRFRHSLITSIILFTFAVSCNTTPLEDALENFGIVIELPEIETELSIQLLDATTGELIEQPVEIMFFGDRNGDAKFVDMYSDEISEFTTNTGFMNIGIENGASISESSPIVMGVTMKADGYKDQASAIEIKKKGLNYFVMELIPLSNPPVGISIVKEALVNVVTNGVLNEDLIFSASEETGPLTPTVGLSLPEGTVLKNANGTPLNGQLSAEVVIYNASIPDVMRLASPTLFQDDEDSARVIYGVWETKVMDQSGRVATSMELPAAFRNATCIGPYGTYTGGYTSGCSKQLPDAVMASAFDNPLFQNQLWWFGTPNPTPPQSVVTFEFQPLSDLPTWTRPAFGWFSDFEFEACVLGVTSFSQNPSCSGDSPSNTVSVSQRTEAKDIEVNISRNGHTSPLRVTMTSKGGYSEMTEVVEGSSFIFTQTHAPVTDEDYTVKVQIAALPGDVITKTINRSEYESGEVTISLPSADALLVDASLRVNLQCSNPDEDPTITDIPTASLYYRLSESEAGDGYNPWRPTTKIAFTQGSPVRFVTGGTTTLTGVLRSKAYELKLVYDDEVITREVNVNGLQVEYTENLDDDICQ